LGSQKVFNGLSPGRALPAKRSRKSRNGSKRPAVKKKDGQKVALGAVEENLKKLQQMGEEDPEVIGTGKKQGRSKTGRKKV